MMTNNRIAENYRWFIPAEECIDEELVIGIQTDSMTGRAGFVVYRKEDKKLCMENIIVGVMAGVAEACLEFIREFPNVSLAITRNSNGIMLIDHLLHRGYSEKIYKEIQDDHIFHGIAHTRAKKEIGLAALHEYYDNFCTKGELPMICGIVSNRTNEAILDDPKVDANLLNAHINAFIAMNK